MKSLKTLIAETNQKERSKMLRELESLCPEAAGQPALQSEELTHLNETVELVKSLMTSHVSRDRALEGVTNAEHREFLQNWQRGGQTPLSFAEALGSNDASMVFKRVISDVLMTPVETQYIGQDILAKTVHVDSTRSVMFPALGAIKAGDIPEGGNYPEQLPGITSHSVELKTQRSGLKLAVNEDVIEDSMWDIFGLYVTMAANAMKRWKEEKIFTTAFEVAHTVYDNTGANANGFTTGVDTKNVLNGSITFSDLMYTLGGVMANGYSVTDLCLHPLAWVMLAQDPRLLFHTLGSSSFGQSVPMPGLDANSIQKNLPFGMLNVVVTPQMPFQYETSITMNGSTMPACNVGSILALDRQSSLIVLQRQDMQMDEFRHQERDIHMLKVNERYAVGALDMGRGMAQMKGIRFTPAHNSLYNIGFGNIA